ncbi:hypothetical protein POPTR_004G122466v4 [Populus trichocarpa]|uniref:Uncharacterized protein n=1 Tax=Populus trichocarpa TaxID=3694 RepID=A0ACC0T4A8_POPTR|nr:hypothetical protein BDE02_04G108500 [Populus trichocarpa]KAI9396393.1 hypothetical protein POPTR_004G122466v4 [Populus trichocarpa]
MYILYFYTNLEVEITLTTNLQRKSQQETQILQACLCPQPAPPTKKKEWYFRNSLPDQLRPCKDEIPEVQEDYL